MKNSKKSNFLVYFPLLPQIRRILREHFEVIIDYLHRERVMDNISDVDDGLLYKKLSLENIDTELLTLTMNLDGANIFKSCRSSLWPVQFILNFLPPAMRYSPENMIVSVLYYGNEKPDMNKLIFPIAKEIETSQETFSVLTSENSFVHFQLNILLISCDLPAKAAVQNFIGHNGKYGCSYCYHPGTAITNRSGKSTTIRFIEQPNIQLRTHDEAVQTSIKCADGTINGIKGPSAAIMLPQIDLIKSFPIDMMHGTGLGVMKDLIQIWTGKKKLPKPPYAEYKLKLSDINILDSRLSKLKPPMFVRRKPRSILEVVDFKASECFDFMWFYLRYTLPGLLPTKIIKNYEKLAVSTYILCKENVSLCEVNIACEMLNDFAIDFESIYGKGAVTMNIHLLKHYKESVINCGPLWSYSLFAFENNIGVLKNYVYGRTDVLEQISKKYAASKIHSGNSEQKKIFAMIFLNEHTLKSNRNSSLFYQILECVLKKTNGFGFGDASTLMMKYLHRRLQLPLIHATILYN